MRYEEQVRDHTELSPAELETALTRYAAAPLRGLGMTVIGLVVVLVGVGWLLRWLGVSTTIHLPPLASVAILSAGVGFGVVLLNFEQRVALTPRRLQLLWLALATTPGLVALVLSRIDPEQLAPFILDVPPFFWCALITLSVVMLKPAVSVAIGLWCGLQYLLVHLAATPDLTLLQGPEKLVSELSSPGAGARRAGLLALLGVVTAGAGQVFRGALFDLLRHRERAERERLRVEAERRHAEAVSQSKTRFLAELSHELRTPLNGVIGNADLLLRQQRLDAAAQTRVQTVLENARYLADLVADAMDTALVETGRISLQPRPFAPGALLEEICALFQHAAAERRLTLSAHAAADTPAQVLGDPKRVRQIVINLLSNALKNTREGGVRLRVEGRDPIVFVVSDTGDGIPEAEQARIFEAYAQAGTDAQRARGVGLGLAITSALVTAMDGQIALESAVGVGTTVRIALPLPEVSAVASPAQASAAPADAPIEQFPAEHEVAQIREAADLGDMTRLRELLADLRERPNLAAFVERVDGLARAFDDEAILALIDQRDPPR